MAEETKADQPKAGVRRVAWGIYQHVAAVLGAFSMAVFIGEVFDIGWRGFLAKLVGVWAEYVRPVANWVAEAFVWPLERLFDWDIQVPLLLRDYLSVAIVFLLSMLRVFKSGGELRKALWPFHSAFKHQKATPVSRISAWPVMRALFWPAYSFYLAIISLFLIYQGDSDWTWVVTMISPLLYLSLLLAINYFILG